MQKLLILIVTFVAGVAYAAPAMNVFTINTSDPMGYMEWARKALLLPVLHQMQPLLEYVFQVMVLRNLVTCTILIYLIVMQIQFLEITMILLLQQK